MFTILDGGPNIKHTVPTLLKGSVTRLSVAQSQHFQAKAHGSKTFYIDIT